VDVNGRSEGSIESFIYKLCMFPVRSCANKDQSKITYVSFLAESRCEDATAKVSR